MEHKVTEGNSYLITAKGVTTVTDVESGYVLKSVPSNSQSVIVAISDKIEVSGECNIRPFDVDLLTRNHPATYSRQPVSDWKTYMLKRAEMTGEQKNIDTVNRAIIGDALLQNRFNEDWQNLYSYEVLSGENLSADVWNAYFDAVERWCENPVVDKEYNTSNPLPDDGHPLIDFNVLSIGGSAYGDYMSVENRGIFYLPNANAAKFLSLTGQTNGVYVSVENATDIQAILRGCKTTGDVYVFAPKSTDAHYLAMGVNAKRIFARLGSITKSNQSFWDTKVDEVFIECDSFDGNYRAFDSSRARKVAIRSGRPASSFSATFRNMPNLVELEVDLSDATSLSDTLLSSGLFNSPVTISKCKSAQGAFKNTAMSAENISKTLDSLPTWTDGASHVITFTGSPGAAELTQDSPSVAAAIAKGWTVEL